MLYEVITIDGIGGVEDPQPALGIRELLFRSGPQLGVRDHDFRRDLQDLVGPGGARASRYQQQSGAFRYLVTKTLRVGPAIVRRNNFV